MMAERDGEFLDLGNLWVSREGQASTMNGKLSTAARLLLGVPKDASVILMKIPPEQRRSDKSPAYRLTVAFSAAEGDAGASARREADPDWNEDRQPGPAPAAASGSGRFGDRGASDPFAEE